MEDKLSEFDNEQHEKIVAKSSFEARILILVLLLIVLFLMARTVYIYLPSL